MMGTVRAVLFDMDGLMFDTEKPYILLLEKIFNEYGFRPTRDFIFEFIGCSSTKVADYEIKYPGITKAIEEADIRFDDFFFEMFPKKGDANKPGLKELYFYLRENGYKIAIASSSRERHIRNLLAYCGFDFNPDVIVSSHTGIPSKPAPDVFLEAARRLNVLPEECLVLEDSKFGTMAAYNAQMHRVLIPDMVAIDAELEVYIEYIGKTLLDVIPILERNKL